MKRKNNFKSAAKTALEMLKEGGFEAFLIGGSVRDYLMGLPIGDIDVATNATPYEVEDIFKDYNVIETGIKHGTVTVILEGEPVEITTYRSEGEYSDNRHPDNVEFSRSLRDDVIRRDFTVNGVAYSFENGFCDLVGGIEDINNGIIRCIGDAETRFREDALRIMRALRFSSVLGFTIEENTKIAIRKCKDLLKNISAERIREETVKLICGKNAYEVLEEFPDVLGVILPEIKPLIGFEQINRHHIYDVYTHTLKAMTQSRPSKTIRLALLFHDIGKPACATFDEKGEMHFYSHPKKSAEITESIMTRLRFDNDTKNKVVTLVKFHDSPITVQEGNYPDRRRIKRIMSQIGEKLIYDLIEIKRCDNSAQNPDYYRGDEFYGKTLEMIDEIIGEKECFSVKDLKINGNDLLRMGYKGKEIGETLRICLDGVIDGRIKNGYEELKEYIKEL